jgi:hypothetical protein
MVDMATVLLTAAVDHIVAAAHTRGVIVAVKEWPRAPAG